MKFADGNSQLGTGEHSTTTPPRRNIPVTGAKNMEARRKEYLRLITCKVFGFLKTICPDNSTKVVLRIIIMQCNIGGRLRVECWHTSTPSFLTRTSTQVGNRIFRLRTSTLIENVTCVELPTIAY
jgi:hypothetical protein